jgi:hypothetical protein
MRYRHEQMIRARELRAWRRLEDALWSSLTADERRLWLSYTAAVAKVEPA